MREDGAWTPNEDLGAGQREGLPPRRMRLHKARIMRNEEGASGGRNPNAGELGGVRTSGSRNV